ncbi:MAG: hypothetical protein RR636_14970 [Clostridium sp.]
MKKNIGLFLIGLSILTMSIVIAITKVSITLKQVANGNYGISSLPYEISSFSYLLISISIIIGVYIYKTREKNN